MKARITASGPSTLGSPVCRIELDDKDVSYAVSGAVLRLGAGLFPELDLDLRVMESVNFSGEVDVVIPEHTRQLLIDLGWTPPISEAKES